MAALTKKDNRRPVSPEMPYEELLERAAEYGFKRPAVIDPDQAWVWTPEWLAGTIQAFEDLAAGRTTYFDSDEEFLAELERRRKHANLRGG